MLTLPLAEITAGLIALILTAMAFTNLMWSEGASSHELKQASARKTKSLFIWAGVFWALTAVLAYLSVLQAPPLPSL